MTVQHEDHAKEEDGTKMEFHVIKQQLKKNMKLHRQMNEFQQEHEEQWAQRALMDEIHLYKLRIHPNS